MHGMCHQCSNDFWPRLFLIFCPDSRTEAYWGEAKKGGFWPRVSTKAIGVLFCPGSLKTRSHRGTSFAPPLALLCSSSPSRSSANAVVTKPSPAVNEQPTAMLRPMVFAQGRR
ncbi:hypothetical protein DEO72_LG3g1978 [Vigna unguiculata]|uniref:Uncharacterized protein n=1 Tax=Vigna unguiculata TaxID=3917 RepID=A0A4D6LFM5_VIGUN|nr:hypothetical protein DEO72_LG3g1978 [Vigna unguiculata]